jgi:exonuclease VII small subunit
MFLNSFSFLATKMLSTHAQLNEIEDAMSNLESTILHLDAYSRSLESQVKKFEKTFVATRTTSITKD